MSAPITNLKRTPEKRQERTDYMRDYRKRFNSQKSMARRKIILDRNIVEQLYLKERYSVGQTALKLGVGRTTIMRNLNAWGILIRPASEQNHIDLSVGRRIISWKGEGSPNWKGGRSMKDGYVYIATPDLSKPGRSRRIPEHVLVWEQANNKKLPKGWNVHHKNGVRNDNRPCNLMALNPSEHMKTTHRMIESLKSRIRELEAENKLLQKALEAGQMIFTLSEN
jgi:hypothetical protein